MASKGIQKRRPLSSQVPTSVIPYKRGPFGQRFHDLLFSLILSRLSPQQSRWLFLLGGHETKEVSATAGTWAVLENVFYTYPEWAAEDKSLSGRLWWELLDNARATRNRLLLVRDEVRNAAFEVVQEQSAVHILSIGAGSGRAVLLAVRELGDVEVTLTLVDKDPTALQYNAQLSQIMGVNHATRTVGDFLQLRNRFGANVVEMVGLLDYLNEDRAVQFLGLARRQLGRGGTFITANIVPNPEKPFVHKAIGWPKMHYRTAGQLRALLQKAGFEGELRIIPELLGIYNLAVVKCKGA